MAKMFYSLEEAAERLNVPVDRVKEMAASGQLQQFRDRDKLMFKRDQVDALASGGASPAEDSGAPIDLADSRAGTSMGSSLGPIALADSGDTNALDLSDTRAGQTAAGQTGAGESRAGTGVSVFEAGEVEPADPMAQTQLTKSVDDEDLALESVGSGSGLLDLTRESDDTSLGAELLDEIYPGGEASDSKMASAVGSSGVFESALGMETGAGATGGGPSGLSGLTAATPVAPSVGVDTGPTSMAAYDTEAIDPAWSGASAGALLAATVALIIGLVVIIGALNGVTGGLTATLVGFGPLIVLIGLLLLALVLGGVGFFVGKAAR